jgi:hypothetical protein
VLLAGYGDADTTTVVSFGNNTRRRYTTTYFRKTIDFQRATVGGKPVVYVMLF